MKKLMKMIIGERAKRARHSQVCSIENRGYIYILCIIGERAKRARHSHVCSIENRGYIYVTVSEKRDHFGYKMIFQYKRF